MSDRFRIYSDIRAWKSQGSENELRIGGICSTDCLDRQSENVLADGLNFEKFLSYGWFNDNHGQKTTDVRGYPTGVKRVRKGDNLPDGTTCEVNGWWTEGYLTDTDEGRAIHALAIALEGTKRGLGFSIEGNVSRRKGSTVCEADVSNVAITHVPVNQETHLVALTKALMAGSGVASHEVSGGTPGDAGPLRPESLEGGLTVAEEEEDETEATIATATHEPVVKAEGDNASLGGIPMISERHYVESWADALQYGVTNMGTPSSATLTKSEAAIVASQHTQGLRPRDLPGVT